MSSGFGSLGVVDLDQLPGSAAHPDDGKSYREILYDTLQALKPDAGFEDVDEYTIRQKPMYPNFSRLVSAAYDHATYSQQQASQGNALYAVAQKRIAAVQRETGEVLENPFGSGYIKEADQRFWQGYANGGDQNITDYYGYNPETFPIGRDAFLGTVGSKRRQTQVDIFNEKIADLAQRFPDKAQAFEFGKTLQEEAVDLGRQSIAEYKAAQKNIGGVAGFAAEAAGGIAAVVNSPVDLYSMVVAPVGAVGNVAARILTAGVTNAGLSVPLTLIARDDRTRWLKMLEEEIPSLPKDLLDNALGAFIGGAGIQGGVEAVRPLAKAFGRILGGTPEKGDVRLVKDHLGDNLQPEEKAALDIAETQTRLDTQILQEMPDGLPMAQKQEVLKDALQHALDPDMPTPPQIPDVQAGLTDRAARVLIDTVDDPLQAVQMLKTAPDKQAIASALTSEDPFIRNAGLVANLSDAAFAQVEAGQASLAHARVVAEYSPSPLHDADLLGALTKANPASEMEARAIMGDALGRIENQANLDLVQQELIPPSRLDAMSNPREILPAKSAPTLSSGNSYKFDVKDLKIDAKTMQFKSEGGNLGVTPILRGVTEWSPEAAGTVMVWQAKNGDFYIADGHQRTGLARKLMAEGRAENIEITGTLYRELDGYSAQNVMIRAAIKNLREGSGALLDGAKILRSAPEYMKVLQQISRESTRQMVDLAKLSDESFRMVINEVVQPSHAAFVGKYIDDPVRQKMALEVLAKVDPSSNQEAQIIVRRLVDAEMRKAETGNQGALFDFNDAATTFFEENKILSKAVTELRRDKSLFSRVVREAETLESAGSRIERDASQQVAEDAARLSFILEKNADKQGEIRTALLQAAKELKDGTKNLSAATRDFTDALRTHRLETAFDGETPRIDPLSGGQNSGGTGVETRNAGSDDPRPQNMDGSRSAQDAANGSDGRQGGLEPTKSKDTLDAFPDEQGSLLFERQALVEAAKPDQAVSYIVKNCAF